ncbi:MAG: endolytic transglycosylase MltG [Cytophagales bacterium]|nr:endolytic transglycosylase MltG [Cytophagales bacterium]
MGFFNLRSALIIFVSILVSTFVFYGYQMAFTPNILVNDQKELFIFLPENANFQTVKDSLAKYEVLNDNLSFLFLSKVIGYQEKVRSGRYLFTPGMTNLQAIKMLYNGRQAPIRLTFNTFRLKNDLAEFIGSKMAFSSDEFLKVLNNPDIINRYGFNSENSMCLFIPNTYDVYWTVGPEKFLARMYDEYQKFWTEDRREKAKVLGLSYKEVSILASIVEEETHKDDEKPRVAGVYLNRLRKGMKLQADPTIKFALGDFTLKRVTNLSVDSPYNTYRFKGLPPGPINNPSVSSIDAVLNAENHEYLFFCARPDLTGYHDFSKTFDEHVSYAQTYRGKITEMGIQ